MSSTAPIAPARPASSPNWGALRSALAGFLVMAATSAASAYCGQACGTAAGTVTQDLVLPVLHGAVGAVALGVGTWVRKKRADAIHAETSAK